MLTRFQPVGHLICASIFFALLMCGCTNPFKKQPVIALDDWWNIDYAKTACEQRQDDPWCWNPTRSALQYENRVEAAFAADPACRGLLLIHWAGPRNSKAADDVMPRKGATDWQLMIDLTPDSKEGPVGWGIVNKRNSVETFSQEAQTPDQLARDACGIARGAGGSVR